MRFSASKRELLGECQYPFRPEIEVDDTPGRAALEGTALHALADAHVNGEPTPVLDPNEIDVDRVMQLFVSWKDWWPNFSAGLQWRTEVPFALDMVTGAARVLKSNGPRDYSDARPSESVGTGDAVAVDVQNDCVVVVDLKTGQPVTGAETNGQMAMLGLAAARANGVSNARVILAYVRPTAVYVDEAVLYGLDLDMVFESTAELFLKIPTSEPTPGKHCSGLYCPIRHSCPATTQALASVVPKRLLPIVGDASKIQGPEHAAQMYAQLRAAKAALDAAWNALRIFADQNGGVDAGGGKVWIKSESKRDEIDLEVRGGVEALKAAFGDDWRNAVELSTTKKAIEEAARVHAKSHGLKIKDVNARALTALREVGALRAKVGTSYDEVEIRDERKGAA